MMRSILDTRTKRHVQIIEHLSFNQYTSIQGLMELTKTSDKTILNDLDYISEHWGEDLDMKSYRDIYYIQEKTIATMHKTFRELFSNSLPILFTLIVFQYPNKSMKAHANRLHVSESSIYRLLPSLNKFLETIDLRVENHNGLYHLHSVNECYLRHFITTLYLETQYIDEVLKQKELEDLDLIFEELFKSFDIFADTTQKSFYKLYYKLSLMRELQGFEGIYFTDVAVDFAFNIMSSHIPSLEKENIQRIHGSIIEMLVAKSTDSKEIDRLKKSIVEGLNLNLDDEGRRKLHLLAADAYTYITFYPFKVASLFDRYHYFSQNFKQQNHKVYTKIETIINEFADMSSNIYRLSLDYFVYYLNIYFYDDIVKSVKIHIGVISEMGREHTNFIRKFIQNHFTYCEVHNEDIFSLAFSRSTDEFDSSRYDLIISTTYLESLSNNDYLLINDYPDTLDLARINSRIQVAYKNK